MSYHAVAAITDRRISDTDGAVEYAVEWVGYEGETTWEGRRHVTENCAEMVQVIDQRCMDTTDAALLQWRRSRWQENAKPPPATLPAAAAGRKRSRSHSGSDSSARASNASQTEGDEGAEVLHGLLLRGPQRVGAKSSGSSDDTSGSGGGVSTGMTEATVLLLGEVVLAEEASASLNSGKPQRKRRQQSAARAALIESTAPALEVEKAWRDAHGHSLLHSVETAHAVTPFSGHYALHHDDAETRRLMEQEALRSSHLRILSIAPPLTTHSGAVFAAPVALDGLVGEQDVDEMRLSVQLESPLYGLTAQEIVKPHVEQMVVRYMMSEPLRSSAAPRSLELLSSEDTVASMPLSVFRLVFPQLLIDYLLENSVVLH